jgi:hypothetical protein
MRRIGLLILPLILAAGCAPTTYRKTVTVTKDGQGEIQEIVVVEEIVQAYREPVQEPKYLDEWRTGTLCPQIRNMLGGRSVEPAWVRAPAGDCRSASRQSRWRHLVNCGSALRARLAMPILGRQRLKHVLCA